MRKMMYNQALFILHKNAFRFHGVIGKGVFDSNSKENHLVV